MKPFDATDSSYGIVKSTIKSLFLISLGIVIATLGLKGFLIPNEFIDGGVTGASMLISDIFNSELAIAILLINTPFVLLGIKQIGWKFAIRSAIAIVAFASFLHIATFPTMTHDKLLSAVFGGIAVGAGIGLAFRGGAVLDGTEILAILLSKQAGIRVGDVILVFNIIIFSVAAFYLGIEPALYSVLTYMAASKAVDFLVYGFELLGVTIFSKESETIKKAILEDLGLALTSKLVKTGLGNTEHESLFCVCSTLEAPKLQNLVIQLDKSAFVTVHKITDTYGGMLKRAKPAQKKR